MSISLGIPSSSKSFETLTGITEVVSFKPHAYAGVETTILNWYPLNVSGALVIVKVSESAPTNGGNLGTGDQIFPVSALTYHWYTAVPVTSTTVPSTIGSPPSTLSVTGSDIITACEPKSK